MRGQEARITRIANAKRSEAEDQSMEVAESSRELEWKSKSFIGGLFMGSFDMTLAFPFPLQNSEDKAIGDAICSRVEAWASTAIDGAEIDRLGKIPNSV